MSNNYRATPAQIPGENAITAPLEPEFLDSPFLRWVKLADMLLSKPRCPEESSEFSN
jgi:hypothetical protein